MNIEQLIADLRARINPQYYDQVGTESYERHQCVMALEYLATENERLKELMAKRTREHQQEMTSFRLRVRSQDAATFAALREENERLRNDAERIDWISRQYLDGLCLTLVVDADHDGEYYVAGDDNQTGYGPTLRAAIDAARSSKALPEPAP